MDKKRRWLFISMCIISSIGVAFLAASFATEYWVVAHPRKRIDRDTEASAINVTGGDLTTKFKGYIHFGLFHGRKSLDHGLGPREEEIWTINLARDLFNFGLWISLIVFDGIAICLGFLAMLLSAINAFTHPSETLTGPVGVYISNALYALTSMIAIVLTLALYFTDLRDNVLTEDDRLIRMWTSYRRVDLHYSFYLVVAASLLGAINVAVATYARVAALRRREATEVHDKMPDGLMMY